MADPVKLGNIVSEERSFAEHFTILFGHQERVVTVTSERDDHQHDSQSYVGANVYPVWQ